MIGGSGGDLEARFEDEFSRSHWPAGSCAAASEACGSSYCVSALGVGVIAAVGTLRAAVDAGLSADGRALLGGDLEIDGGSQDLPDSVDRLASSRGATTSRVVQMRSMLVAQSGERQLIELKG